MPRPTLHRVKAKAVVILPTYNERGNIERLILDIIRQREELPFVDLAILVVDDSSPDGTAQVVRKLRTEHDMVHLLANGRKRGLGAAYVRGFRHALASLKADIVFEMDADFSHDPHVLPELIDQIRLGADFVIGSRYVQGGSVPSDWPWFRKLNSRVANLLARHLAGIRGVQDSTSGFRAIRADLLRRIDLHRLGAQGYAFQINLLHEAMRKGARVMEIPIRFYDRKHGKSKIRLRDITEFIRNSVKIGLRAILPVMILLGIGTLVLGSAAVGYALVSAGLLTWSAFLAWLVVVMSTLLIIQGVLTLIWMMYAWENPDAIENNASPKTFAPARHTFTAIIPARHEFEVIWDTVAAVAAIDYPADKKEIIVVCRSDDRDTIHAAQAAIESLSIPHARVVLFNDQPINKPHALNVGLEEVSNEVVVVFDAEDQPHRDIYKVVNTLLIRRKVDVVQSGVQLMNFRKPWFATLNILEYFFWFKSALHFFASYGTIPLGGNTVFFKREWLDKVGGWDEACLTEDAEIGIRLTAAGAKTAIVYDERHATQEETPTDLPGFIKQRTRWNQGFLQVFLKGDWLHYPNLSQRIFACYILIWPFIQAGMILYLPVPVILALWFKLPIVVAMYANIPLYIFLIQIIALQVGFYEFLKDYGFRYSLRGAIRIAVSVIPFHLVLGISSFRAVFRMLANDNTWEKTAHVNAHRQTESLALYDARKEAQV